MKQLWSRNIKFLSYIKALCLTAQLQLAFGQELSPTIIEDMSFESVSTWSNLDLEAELGWNSSKTKTFIQDFKVAFNDVLQRRPQPFSIFIDANWSNSAGVFFPNDLDPNGIPQIRIRPSILNSRHSGVRVIFHEWIHWIHHQAQAQEEAWLREGLALISEVEVFDYLPSSWRAALESPETSLTAQIDPEKIDFMDDPKVAPQYGHWLQFFYFLKKSCAIPQMLDWILDKELQADEVAPALRVGVKGLDQRIRRHRATQGGLQESCKDFETLFKAFQRARFFPKYTKLDGFLNIGPLSVKIRKQPQDLPPYSAVAYELGERSACENQDELILGRYCFRVRMQ